MDGEFDLDLIVIYDFDPEPSELRGERATLRREYFAPRLTQRLISALTVPTNYGVLYAVDMRLRPSGRSGPVGYADQGFVELSGARSVDLGAHGAHSRAASVPVPGIRHADPADDHQVIMPQA